MSAAISIIVAIYQAENYLKRCVDSILGQSFKDIEVLLINDGSTDKSGEICDEYARKDSRVVVVHKANEGRSLTRQKGLDLSTGEYTIHCDPDDWMDEDMLETMYRKAKSCDADIVICDMVMEEESVSRFSKQMPSQLSSCRMIREMYSPISPSLCNKLIRKACYQSGKIYFPKEVIYAEDLYAMLLLLSTNLKITYVPNTFYHYDRVVNKFSITKNIDLDSYIQTVNFFDDTIGEYAYDAICRVKCDVLWHAYREKEQPFRDYNQLYKEANSFMLVEGVSHPVKHWNYWVMWLHRKGFRRMGTFGYSVVKLALRFK